MKNKTEEHIESGNRRKWPWFILLGIILLVAALRFSLKTDLVRNIVKSQVVSSVNDQLRVELSIQELKGDLWKELEVQGISITDSDKDTLGSIDSLRIGYNILSYFQSVFQISDISISEPYVKLRQKDGEINLSTWLKPSPQDTAQSEPFPVRVKDFQLSGGKVDAQLETLSEDSAFIIDNLHLRSNFALLETGYEASISDFSFDVLQTRFSEKITFESSLQAGEKTISLEKLVLATGNSIIRSSGNFDTQDSTASLDLQALPLSWRDIAAYVDQSPVEQNLEIKLQASGTMSQFQLDLEVEADGISDLELSSSFNWDSTLALSNIAIRAERLNLDSFLGDSSMPDINNLAFEGQGYIPLPAYEEGSLEGSLTTANIINSPYKLDLLESTFSFENNTLDVTVNTQQANQKIEANLNIGNVWDSQSGVEFIAEGRNIDPGYWLQDDQYGGSISFNGKLTGTGLTPEESSWNYSLDFARGTVAQQSFDGISLNGRFNKSSITNETKLRINESELFLKARVNNYQDTPQFSYEINSPGFDLSELRTLEDFETALTFTASGEGTGSSPPDLSMLSVIKVDSSIVNGERIKSLQANIQIEDTVVSVSEATLQSTIAEGSFDASFHLERWFNIGNELNFNLDLKDLQALAPLVEADVLRAEGKVRGKLIPDREENLKFNGNIDFAGIKYDEIFTAEKVSGDLEVLLKRAPEYTLDIELISPVISTIQLQDLMLKTQGEISDKEVDGSFELNFAGTSDGAILHEGEYRIEPNSSVITTNRYDLTSSSLNLTLQRPFRVTIQSQSVRMDTMTLASDEGTLLELAVPYADSIRQSGHLVGKKLNISEIQRILLGETYIDGILSGNLSVANTDTSLEASAKLSLAELSYEGTSVDSLKMDLNIENNLLNGSLSINNNNDELLTGILNLPFKFGDPEEFDESFYKKPVEGSLRINRVELNRFENLLKSMGMVETGGILVANADLNGTAGEPRFSASMSLDSARISGVDVDSITAEIKYVQETSTLSLSGAVNTLKQRAADVKAEIPFHVSLVDGEISLPGKKDSLNITVETNGFNLAALNDFVGSEAVQNIKGRVNGKVNVTGTVAEFDANGELNFSESSFRVVETGVTVEGIRSTLAFSPDLVTVKNFRAQSGSGSMNMNGSISFEELVPGNLDLKINAKNFRVANTSEINAAINMDTKVGGSFTKPDVSGSLTVVNGFIQLDNFGESSVEAVQLDTTEQIDYSVSLYDSLSMDMDIAFDRRFFIRNQRYLELQVELDGSVDMLKEVGEDLQMFGNLQAVSGYARPLGKRFELEEGSVTFTGEPTNPNLNIRTLFEPLQPEEEIKIWYIIEGRVEDPQFKYESSPPMELEDILCYTLFSQPCYALDSWKQAIASTGSSAGATELALELFSDRIETLAAQSLGIDVFRIDNATVGGETGTSITTGWYINPKVFFAIQNIVTGTTPDTSFLLEYSLLQNLKLILSQGNESGQALDIKWNYDY